ncbi:MAG: hypothetical protein HZB38_01660 [Planctomycetes bacterium]|nr:hypothetical protein [Planctomycetota bacterium]
MTPLLVVLAIVQAALVGAGQAAEDGFSLDRPSALQAMEQARRSITRADIRWSRTDYFDQFAPGMRKQYRSRFAGSDSAFDNDGVDGGIYGVEGGIAAWREGGKPIPESRNACLFRETDAWMLETDYLIGETSSREKSPYVSLDVRNIGLLPVPHLAASVAEAIWNYPAEDSSERLYRQRIRDGIYEVELKLPHNDTLIRWEIDPSKGWNPVRSQYVYRGRIFTECRSDYVLEGGTWFPTGVTYFDIAGNIVTQLDVESREIGGDRLPDSLTPESIGFGTGMQVKVDGASEVKVFVAGKPPVASDEYLRLRKEGAVQTDPRLIERGKELMRRSQLAAAGAENSGGGPPAAGPASQPAIVPNKVDDEWERYTREFIHRYALDSEQRQKAQLILHECQERRTTYLRTKKDALNKIEMKLLSKPADSEKSRVTEQVAEMLKPVERIFEEQLKPRLDRLPTRAQREAAKKDAPANNPK